MSNFLDNFLKDSFQLESGDDMRYFINYYHCVDCDEFWEDTWNCTCNDRCSKCGKEIQPEYSVEVEE